MKSKTMQAVALAAVMACVAEEAHGAPFEPISFKKGQSALVYDVGSVTRKGVDAQAWVYLIVAHPMDGATMVATYREFGCGMGRTRDLARRFVSAQGETLRAVETPGAWQEVNPGDERFELLERVCAGKPQRVSGQQMSVFDFQTVVREALTTGPR